MSKPVSNLFHSDQIISCLALRRECRSPETLADNPLSYSKNHQDQMGLHSRVGGLDLSRPQKKELAISAQIKARTGGITFPIDDLRFPRLKARRSVAWIIRLSETNS